jgi:hypothetical protein
VVGTGGENLFPLSRHPETLASYDDQDFGVLVMTLHPTSYDWKFVTIGNRVIDSGTSSCHGPSSGPSSARAARDVPTSNRARLRSPNLSFSATPLRRSLTSVARNGLPVAIHCSRACDVGVTAWLRRAGRRHRVAHAWETESNIPRRHSRIVLRLPARALAGRAAVTLVLRFAAVDAANHHHLLTRTVRLTAR